MGVQDPTSTPLTFSLTTRVNEAALPNCKAWIDDVRKAEEADMGVGHRDDQDQAAAEDFTAVDLSGSSANIARRSVSGSSRQSSSQWSPGHAARTSSVSSTPQLSLDPGAAGGNSHARRRSSNKTPAASPDMRRKQSIPTFEGVREEEAGEEDANQQACTIPQAPSPASTTASAKPAQCYFLLLDGAARLPPPSTSSVASSLAPGRISEGSQRLGWARWAWSLMPEPLRPQLAFDTTKSFSVRWIEVAAAVAASGVSGSNSASNGAKPVTSVEVMRYEDEGSGWSSVFDGRTRGRFVFQEEAVKALRIDRAFWMAVRAGDGD